MLECWSDSYNNRMHQNFLVSFGLQLEGIMQINTGVGELRVHPKVMPDKEVKPVPLKNHRLIFEHPDFQTCTLN